jgi:VWFA-related protein
MPASRVTNRLFRSYGYLLLLAFALTAYAQDPKPETVPPPASGDTAQSITPTLRLGTKLVIIDVVVQDKQHKLHNDLKKEDFHVFEEGQPQTILSFEAPATHVLPPGPPIESTADLEKRAPQAPVNVIVIDEMNTRFEDTAFARYSLEKYLASQPDPLVAPTMLIALSFDHFTVLRDYTQSKGEIKKAIDHHMTTYPFAAKRGESAVVLMAKSLGAMEQVAKATNGHPGHKNIIWVGRGFHGIDLANPNLDANSVKSLQSGVQQAVNIMRDSRITLYTIDPTALSSTVAYTQDDNSPLGTMGDELGPSPFDGDINFASFATATGGKAFWSRNDVDAEVGESVRDGVNFYTLSYRPSSASDDAHPFRKIRVTFDKPELRASFPGGYYVNEDAVPVNNKGRVAYDLASAEVSTMVYTGLSVKAIAKPNSPGTYIVGVPENQLNWTPAGDDETATVKLVGVTLDKKGKMLKRATNEVTAKRPISATTATATGLVKLEITLPTDPGTVRVRFVVNSNADGKMGTADLTADQISPQ